MKQWKEKRTEEEEEKGEGDSGVNELFCTSERRAVICSQY